MGSEGGVHSLTDIKNQIRYPGRGVNRDEK